MRPAHPFPKTRCRRRAAAAQDQRPPSSPTCRHRSRSPLLVGRVRPAEAAAIASVSACGGMTGALILLQRRRDVDTEFLGKGVGGSHGSLALQTGPRHNAVARVTGVADSSAYRARAGMAAEQLYESLPKERATSCAIFPTWSIDSSRMRRNAGAARGAAGGVGGHRPARSVPIRRSRRATAYRRRSHRRALSRTTAAQRRGGGTRNDPPESAATHAGHGNGPESDDGSRTPRARSRARSGDTSRDCVRLKKRSSRARAATARPPAQHVFRLQNANRTCVRPSSGPRVEARAGTLATPCSIVSHFATLVVRQVGEAGEVRHHVVRALSAAGI